MSDNFNNRGAPSSDETSALFVSARKKQLAEQEQQRIAAEQEAARIAAEAEVRRLEAEVEERKRKAQEDAIKIQKEEEERRRMAEVEKARIDAEIRSASTSSQMRQPYSSQVARGSTITANKGFNISELINSIISDKKKLMIVGIAAAAIIVVIVLAIVFIGGGSEARFTHSFDDEVYIILNEDGTTSGVSPEYLEFEGTWTADSDYVYIQSDNYNITLSILSDTIVADPYYEGEFILK